MFAGKTVQNKNVEDVLKIAEKFTYGAIDSPSTHLWSIGGIIA